MLEILLEMLNEREDTGSSLYTSLGGGTIKHISVRPPANGASWRDVSGHPVVRIYLLKVYVHRICSKLFVRYTIISVGGLSNPTLPYIKYSINITTC